MRPSTLTRLNYSAASFKLLSNCHFYTLSSEMCFYLFIFSTQQKWKLELFHSQGEVNRFEKIISPKVFYRCVFFFRKKKDSSHSFQKIKMKRGTKFFMFKKGPFSFNNISKISQRCFLSQQCSAQFYQTPFNVQIHLFFH